MERDDSVRGWSTSETRCLISIWAEDSVQRKLDDSYRNRAVYESIARKMGENGYNRSWQQCQRKIKHLKLAYRKAKDNNCRSGRERITCPFYEELDEVLRDRPSFSPMEGDVLDSADSDMSSCTDSVANVTGESVDDISAGENNEDTTGSEVAAPVSCASDKRKRGTEGSTTRRKKSRFEATLEGFTKALSDSNKDDELMLNMQQAQHSHEKQLFGMMMNCIAPLASAQHPPGHPAPYPWYPPVHQPQPGPVFHNPGMTTELQHTADLPHCSTSVSPQDVSSTPHFQFSSPTSPHHPHYSSL